MFSNIMISEIFLHILIPNQLLETVGLTIFLQSNSLNWIKFSLDHFEILQSVLAMKEMGCGLSASSSGRTPL